MTLQYDRANNTTFCTCFNFSFMLTTSKHRLALNIIYSQMRAHTHTHTRTRTHLSPPVLIQAHQPPHDTSIHLATGRWIINKKLWNFDQVAHVMGAKDNSVVLSYYCLVCSMLTLHEIYACVTTSKANSRAPWPSLVLAIPQSIDP